MPSKNTGIMLAIVVMALIAIAMRGRISCKYGHLASFILIILIGQMITRRIVLSVVLAICIWSVLFIVKRNYLGLEFFAVNENFENDEEEHPDPDTRKRASDMKKLIKKFEGGISLKDEDLFEKNNLDNHNFTQNKETEKEKTESTDKKTDDLKPYEAQRQTYQLIDTVKQLKDTINELAPMLKQGKDVLGQLEALKM
jgi:hypothetical protein